MLPDTEEAEDILQTAFLKLWEQRTTLSSRQSVAGWLFTTSFYLTMTCLRKKIKTRMETLQEETLGNIAEETSDEPGIYGRRTIFLRSAIDCLPERKRRAFELCKIEGLSYKEVADKLGITEETVKEYVKSAVSTLKQLALKTDLSSCILLILFLAWVC